MGKRWAMRRPARASASAHRRETIFLEESPDRIIDLLKNARQPMFLVSSPTSCAGSRRRLCASLRSRRPREAARRRGDLRQGGVPQAASRHARVLFQHGPQGQVHKDHSIEENAGSTRSAVLMRVVSVPAMAPMMRG